MTEKALALLTEKKFSTETTIKHHEPSGPCRNSGRNAAG